MTKKKLTLLSVVIYIAVFGFISLPFSTKRINTIEPHVLGLPFMQFWILAVSIFFCIWLALWWYWEVKLEDRENAEKDKKEVDN